MKFTEKHLKKIIQEELEAVISEAEGSNEENFVATYRAHLMNQGEEDVGIAEQAARKALEVLKITGSWHGDDGQANLPHQSTWED